MTYVLIRRGCTGTTEKKDVKTQREMAGHGPRREASEKPILLTP